MPKKKTGLPVSAKLRPYPLDLNGMSLYEFEGLEAEAILAARKKRKRRLRAIKTKPT
jgi:hypothetical protein